MALPMVEFARPPLGPKIHSRVWNFRSLTSGPLTSVKIAAEPVDCVVLIG